MVFSLAEENVPHTHYLGAWQRQQSLEDHRLLLLQSIEVHYWTKALPKAFIAYFFIPVWYWT